MPSTVIGLRENSQGVGDMWLKFKGEAVAGNFRLIHREVTESWILYVLQIARTVFVCICSAACMLTTEPLTSTEKALMQNKTEQKRGATIKPSCNPIPHSSHHEYFILFFFLFIYVCNIGDGRLSGFMMRSQANTDWQPPGKLRWMVGRQQRRAARAVP